MEESELKKQKQYRLNQIEQYIKALDTVQNSAQMRRIA